MPRTLALAGAALALLGGCGRDDSSAARSAANTASPGGYIARVKALPPGQQRGVVFRAIRDGAKACPELASFTSVADDAGRPAWNAMCSDGGRWRVILADDGTATVTGAAPQ